LEYSIQAHLVSTSPQSFWKTFKEHSPSCIFSRWSGASGALAKSQTLNITRSHKAPTEITGIRYYFLTLRICSGGKKKYWLKKNINTLAVSWSGRFSSPVKLSCSKIAFNAVEPLSTRTELCCHGRRLKPVKSFVPAQPILLLLLLILSPCKPEGKTGRTLRPCVVNRNITLTQQNRIKAEMCNGNTLKQKRSWVGVVSVMWPRNLELLPISVDGSAREGPQISHSSPEILA